MKTIAFALVALTLAASASVAASGSFLLTQPLNQLRRAHTATLLPNGKVLVAGGTPYAPAAAAELYAPDAQGWTVSGALNVGRQFHTATLLPGGTVIVVGGQTAA